MDGFQIVVLALVQGLTEFLPMSSSAHLILTPKILGYSDQGLAFDVAVHLGSLVAVITYFRCEVFVMIRDFLKSLGSRGVQTKNSRMAWKIILATVPIVILGKLMYSMIQSDYRTISVIAISTIAFGVLLLWADIKGVRNRDEYSVTWKDALFIGLFQALAIFPGTSRSGVTMTAGMVIGLTREAASRFSFLLSIPTILMSGALVTFELVLDPLPVAWADLLVGALFSFAAAYICIHVFLRLIERISMLPFVVYRLLLGGVLIWFAMQQV
ncbi:undecaprenyl-diphosphate phosphatase [Solemya velesiana gill symbiont]|uniref:Undecaprenyl-diphosphatase n=1 Tax=Solemya velesiana gill symbiont TaxID=1918948 RepID=A0A1T2KT44_9GAMM|nr:undecaprenyl-diphosphate phosphatase [Solemya velesiana gill symbiont]OOZ35896.1 undecaprenyl-diphosphatase [Solemya velesiana gill symbiont]